ncbi:hypothetical protein DFH09DRAFT_886391, partial [Mycena vulgaris]
TVLTLPPEITSEIFIHSVESNRWEDRTEATSTPLLLLQICRLWRATALSTPALWTNLTPLFDG